MRTSKRWWHAVLKSQGTDWESRHGTGTIQQSAIIWRALWREGYRGLGCLRAERRPVLSSTMPPRPCRQSRTGAKINAMPFPIRHLRSAEVAHQCTWFLHLNTASSGPNQTLEMLMTVYDTKLVEGTSTRP